MIRNEDSPKNGRHYGSLVVRDAIQTHKPLLNVAGHMHESEGRDRIGDTPCINTGLHTTQIINTENLS